MENTMKASTPPSISKCLPLEIESNILSRLPIKDLLRYQCVCKRWHDEIKNPSFIKSHTSQIIKFNNTNSRGFVILFSRSSAKLYSFDYHSPGNVKRLTRLSHSFEHDTQLVGSCNGLLCFRLKEWYLIYNPVIDACKTVFVSPFGIKDTKYRIGFDYDCTSNDYKILQIKKINSLFFGYPKQVESHVYSLKKNSWKVVQPLTIYLSPYSKRMILSNNALHWIEFNPKTTMTTDIMYRIIMCFDLGTEEYHELPLPNNDNGGMIIYELADLRGCLHLVKFCMTHLLSSFVQRMEIWITKEYGVKHTWSKLVGIKLGNIAADEVGSLFLFSQPLIPLLLAYSEDGQEILVDLGQYTKDGVIFLQCDTRSGEFKRLEIQACDLANDSSDGYVVMPWIGSFVSPNL